MGLKNTKLILATVLSALLCRAEVTIPEGTRLRVRLESNISSATAEEGQTVELSVVEAVRIGETIVFAEGARVTGTIVEAREKRRMGRAGKLDFSIDRAKAADNQWVDLRYTVTKKAGESHAVRTGIITAGIAIAFWPAAPVILLMKGKDININKGIPFDVYTNSNHIAWAAQAAPHLAGNAAPPSPLKQPARQQPEPPSPNPSNSAGAPASTATVTITSTTVLAEIEVDGVFVGNTPTTLQLSSGSHRVAVRANDKVWERTLQVNAGSTVSLTAVLK